MRCTDGMDSYVYDTVCSHCHWPAGVVDTGVHVMGIVWKDRSTLWSGVLFDLSVYTFLLAVEHFMTGLALCCMCYAVVVVCSRKCFSPKMMSQPLSVFKHPGEREGGGGLACMMIFSNKNRLARVRADSQQLCQCSFHCGIIVMWLHRHYSLHSA